MQKAVKLVKRHVSEALNVNLNKKLRKIKTFPIDIWFLAITK